MSVLNELRRRNVHRVALAYLAGAWLLIQIADTVFPRIGLSDAVVTGVIVLLAIGFIPALVLSWVFEWTPDGLRRERDIPEAAAHASTNRIDRLIMATLVIAVAYFGVDKFVIDPARDAAEIEAATEEAVKRSYIDAYRDRSIIVLPFLNMSNDVEQEYFADGVTEEILNVLAQIGEIRVISRSTAWTFKGDDIDIAALRDKLEVSHVLEGSIRRAGDSIRITAQLIDARTDTHVWSEAYTREFELEDVFEIQDEISALIVAGLKVELVGEAPHVVEIDPRAYELFLEGRYISDNFVVERYDEGISRLEKVIEIEPEFVPAIWQLTRLVARIAAEEQDPAKRGAGFARIESLINRMVELAPTSGYANGWLANIAVARDGDYQAAARYREKAIAGASDSNKWFQIRRAAHFYYQLGRYEEAAELFRYVLSRDPACVGCIYAMSRSLRDAGKHVEAAKAVEEILEWREPDSDTYWSVGVAWLVAGNAEKALAFFDMDEIRGDLGRILALHTLGRESEFSVEFEQFRHERSVINPESVARVYAWTGQNDLAFEYLEKMIEVQGKQWAGRVKTDLYEPIKSDPRWLAFLERNDAMDQDFSHIEFNPQLPEIGWTPSVIRPAARR